ncbi:MAG: hypothetical protein LBH25_10565 [Fibromonadaceae bacterium]|jgi:hypothetical protein|nr:hypothetical protein [Fibromonadaceae bacterium]
MHGIASDKYEYQNVHSEEEPRTIRYGDPSDRRYVLWRAYTQQLNSNGRMLAAVDSVLREDFYAKEKFNIQGNLEELKNLKPNAYYLALGTAGCSSEAAKRNCFLVIQKVSSQAGKGDDYILPDTPENRAFLDKKWSETKVTYDDLLPGRKVFVDINENMRENRNNSHKNKK